MDTKKIQALAESLWEEYCEIFPRLVRFDCPTITRNNRFTRTAGCCYQPDNRIDLGSKFFAKNERAMLTVILPHELAHQIDYDLNGDSEKKCGHGKAWCDIMLKIGLPANPYHSLEI